MKLYANIGLLITVLGVPMLLATLAIVRTAGDLERLGRQGCSTSTWRSGEYRRRRCGICPAPDPGQRNPSTWKRIAYSVIALPVCTVAFHRPVSAWSVGLVGITVPLWWWGVPHKGDFLYSLGRLDSPVEWLGSRRRGPVAPVSL